MWIRSYLYGPNDTDPGDIFENYINTSPFSGQALYPVMEFGGPGFKRMMGTIHLGTGPGSGTVTGLDFKPKFIMMHSVGYHLTGNHYDVIDPLTSESGTHHTFGCCGPDLSQWTGVNGNGYGSGGSSIGWKEDATLMWGTDTFEITSLDFGGFSYTFGAQFSSNWVTWIAFDFAEDCQVGVYTEPTSNGTVTISTPGFNPRAMWMATVGSTSSNLDQSGGYNNQLCSYYSSDYYERIASCGSANRTVSPSSEVDTVQVLGHGYFPVTLTDPSTSPNHWHAGLPPTWGTEEVVLNYTSFYAVEGVARRWGYVLFGANDSYDSMTPEYPLAVLSSRAAAHVTTEPYTAPGGPYAFYGYWNSHLDFGTGFSIGAAYLSSWNNLYVEGGGGFAWSTTSTGQQDAFTGLGGSSFATYFIDTWDTGTEIPIIIIVVDGISLARLKFRSHL